MSWSIYAEKNKGNNYVIYARMVNKEFELIVVSSCLDVYFVYKMFLQITIIQCNHFLWILFSSWTSFHLQQVASQSADAHTSGSGYSSWHLVHSATPVTSTLGTKPAIPFKLIELWFLKLFELGPPLATVASTIVHMSYITFWLQ